MGQDFASYCSACHFVDSLLVDMSSKKKLLKYQEWKIL